jgi:hypothetical protein
MPKQDNRTIAGSKKGKHSTSGRRAVTYRDAVGKTRSARVLDQGTASGLKLALGSNSNVVIDNVPACSTVKGTSCYMSRTV